MATNASELQKYFADMDAAEEADAAAVGLAPDELRRSRLEPEYVKENRRASRVATEEAARTGEAPRDVLYDTDRMAALEKAGTQRVPPSMATPLEEFARPINTKGSAVGLEQMGRLLRSRLDLPETVPSLSMPSGVPAKTTDFASLQKLMSPGALKAPEAQPIPVASVPAKADVPAVERQALAPTGPANPAPPAGTSSTVKPPPVMDGSGGDDELSSLRTRLGLQQAFEGLGSAASGKNLRTDGGVLVDRMKQIEALRAKRAQAEEDRALEAKTWGASNRAALSSALAQWKGDPERTAALEALASGVDTTKQSDFAKGLYNAVMTKPKVLGAEAATGKTLVQIPDIQAGTAGKVAKNAEIGPEGESKRKLRAAQVAKIYKDMELAGTKLALDERKTIEQAQQSKDPFKKLESLNTIADKKEFGGFTTLAGDLGDLERVAPGFVTRGEVPEWLTREQQALGQNWPTSTDPRVVDFLAAYGKVANEERHRQYGSAQTDGELRAFMQQLNASPLSAGPQVLAQQVKRFGQAAGRVAKGRLTRYNNVFGAENVDTVFAPEWKPLFDAGGVFAGQGTPFVATRAPAAAGGAPEAATVTIKRKTDGKTKTVPAADRAKWLANPEFEEVK